MMRAMALFSPGALLRRLASLRPGRGEGARDAVPVRDWVSVSSGQPARLQGVDQPLIWIAVGLLALGLVMVFSASVALPDSPRYARYAPTYFLVRQLMFIGVGSVAALITVQIPIKVWEQWAPWLFVTALLSLVAVLIPHVGKGVNGARRWIPLGVMNFQPSEWAKLAMVLYAASYMVRKMDVKENFFRAVTPMAIALAIIGVLLLAEPDMGAFMVIAAVALGILFLGGVNGRMFLLSTAVLVGAGSSICGPSTAESTCVRSAG